MPKKKQNPSEKMLLEFQKSIDSLELLPGMQLPSESELCSRYSISRPTVRRILEKLQGQGLIEKRAGIGSFVRQPVSEAQTVSPKFRIGLDFVQDFGPAIFYYGSIIRGICGSRLGSRCLFHYMNSPRELLANLPVDLDALILTRDSNYTSEDFRRIAECGTPALMLNGVADDPGIGYLTIHARKEAELGVLSMIRKGCRDIVLAGSTHPSVQLRVRGWEDAFHAEGLEVPEHLRLSTEDLTYSPEKVREFICGHSFSGVFFTNMAALIRFSLVYLECCHRPLDELELLCFDDLDLMPEYRDLVCSFIRIPVSRMAEIAVDYLYQKKQNPDLPVLRRVFPCSMVVRHRVSDDLSLQ